MSSSRPLVICLGPGTIGILRGASNISECSKRIPPRMWNAFPSSPRLGVDSFKCANLQLISWPERVGPSCGRLYWLCYF